MPVSGNAAIPAGATVLSVGAATVTLSAPATATGSASASYGTLGVFRFSGLTENQYTVTLTKPGFNSRSLAFYLNNANYYLGDGAGQGVASTSAAILTSDPVVLTPTSGGTLLAGAPFIGSAPLTVNYSLALPLAAFTSLGSNVTASWNFGDPADVDDETTLTTARHTYRTAGNYSASVTLTGSANSITVPVTTPIGAVHVQRVAPDTRAGAPAAQIISAGFIGSFAAPLLNANFIEKQPTTPVVYQESKRDSGSLDIDRSDAVPLPLPPATSPYGPFSATTTFNHTKEDSDFDYTKTVYVYYAGAFPTTTYTQSQWRTPLGPAYFTGQNVVPPTDTSSGTYLPYAPASPTASPERFRIFCTMGGFVFGEKPSLVGDYQLQVGRIEP